MEPINYSYAISIAIAIIIFTFAAFQFIWKAEEVRAVSYFTST